MRNPPLVAFAALCGVACVSTPEMPLGAPDASPPEHDGRVDGGSQDRGPDATHPQEADAGDDGRPDAGAPRLPDKPERLSEAGLYADLGSEALAEGVREYSPRYALWSDGAEKRRWVRLPQGRQVDTSNADFWVFPVGTRLWKEFRKGGVRVETRLLHKYAEGPRGWYAMAFAWDAAQTDAVAVPEGVSNALGTGHDIPDQDTCMDCHGGVPDVALGFSALQLAHGGAGLTLQSLLDAAALSEPPALPLEPPGEGKVPEALGYLHANCGTCHNPESSVYGKNGLDLSLSLLALSDLRRTGLWETAVGKPVYEQYGKATVLLVPGDAGASALYERMGSREDMVAMPPVATEQVDAEGLALLEALIHALEGVQP